MGCLRPESDRLLGLDAEEFFDPESVRWYRRVFDERNPGRHQALSDVEFLNEWGFVVEQRELLVPTRATVLMFGRPRHVRRILPRPVVDCQYIDSLSDSWSTDRRWTDRVVVEENLIQAWLMLSDRYICNMPRIRSAWMRRHSGETMIRRTTSRSVRRPSICLSIRTTATTDGRRRSDSSAIRRGSWNPGDAFATTDELLDPTEKEVRNPAIVAAFRRIGLSEQAGTGVRAIFRDWQRLGYVPRSSITTR